MPIQEGASLSHVTDASSHPSADSHVVQTAEAAEPRGEAGQSGAHCPLHPGTWTGDTGTAQGQLAASVSVAQGPQTRPLIGPAGPCFCLPLAWADCPRLCGWLTGVCAGRAAVIEVAPGKQQQQDTRRVGSVCIAHHCGHLAPHRDGPRLPHDPEPQDNAVPIQEPPRTLRLLAQCRAGRTAVMSPQQRPALAFPCPGSLSGRSLPLRDLSLQRFPVPESPCPHHGHPSAAMEAGRHLGDGLA